MSKRKWMPDPNHGTKQWWIDRIKRGKSKIGKKDLLAHLAGEKLSQRHAIYAYCYDCSAYYGNPEDDCKNEMCPLYPYMPYNPNRAKVKRRGAGYSKQKGDDEDDEELS